MHHIGEAAWSAWMLLLGLLFFFFYLKHDFRAWEVLQVPLKSAYDVQNSVLTIHSSNLKFFMHSWVCQLVLLSSFLGACNMAPPILFSKLADWRERSKHGRTPFECAPSTLVVLKLTACTCSFCWLGRKVNGINECIRCHQRQQNAGLYLYCTSPPSGKASSVQWRRSVTWPHSADCVVHKLHSATRGYCVCVCIYIHHSSDVNLV